MALKSLLHLQHRRHARPRRGEHREKRIPLRVHFAAVIRGQSRPDQRVMPGKHLRVRVFPQPPKQRRRALDVGEQEREGLHAHSLEGQPGGGTASRHAITPDPLTRTSRLLTGLAGHPHGAHRPLTPRDARTGRSGGSAAKYPGPAMGNGQECCSNLA